MCLIANKKSQKLSLVKHGENLPAVSVRFSAAVDFLLLIFCRCLLLSLLLLQNELVNNEIYDIKPLI